MKKRYQNKWNLIRGLTHFFGSAYLVLALALFSVNLAVIVGAWVPALLELYQYVAKKLTKQPVDPQDIVYDLVEHYSGMLLSLIVYAVYRATS